MSKVSKTLTFGGATLLSLGLGLGMIMPQISKGDEPSSYMPVVIKESFEAVMNRMKAAKPAIQAKHKSLLEERYDLSNKASGSTMFRGKPLQQGVRVRLAAGTSWDSLGAMSPEEIREKNLFPKGFLPLPHPNHPCLLYTSPSPRD